MSSEVVRFRVRNGADLAIRWFVHNRSQDGHDPAVENLTKHQWIESVMLCIILFKSVSRWRSRSIFCTECRTVV
jgi:hypothetical protein